METAGGQFRKKARFRSLSNSSYKQYFHGERRMIGPGGALNNYYFAWQGFHR